MKKVFILMLALILLCGAAQAQGVSVASGIADLEPLERYASWTEEDGKWSVYSNETAAALSRLGQESGTAAYFCLQLTGDQTIGLIQPELVVYYASSNLTMADTVTLSVNKVRYDFKAVREEEKLGGRTFEVLRVPLDDDGIKAVKKAATGKKVAVQLTGERTYSFEPEIKKSYSSGRYELEAASLKGLDAMLDELDALNIADYELWDLNADRWERLYGVRPEMDVTALTGKTGESGIEIDNRFEMLSRGDSGRAVRELQTLLVNTGYIVGTQDGSFGEGTERAVRAARRYYGLMESGLADRKLVACLNGKETTEKADRADKEDSVTLDGVCELSVNRCWFADAFTSKNGAERAVGNADNTLFIAEGRILNTSAEELTFYWRMNAALKLGEIAYPCTVVCEADDGRRLDTSLLPLAESRMWIYAEIPERIAGESGWVIELTAGEDALTFEVENR